MAHVAKLSDVVRGAIVAVDTQEGLAVTLTQSGVVNGVQQDLPIAVTAPSGSVHGVYAMVAAPDNFPRPVDSRQYTSKWYTTLGRTDGSFSEPKETVTLYRVGLSNLYNPVVPSGALVNCHRGATITVQSTSFVDSSGIHVPGAFVKVADDASGKWTLTTDKTVAVAEVVQWYSDTAELTIQLFQ